MDSFKKYINEEVDLVEGNIDKIKDIVSKKQHSKIDGVMVDLFTASAISQIYDKVNDANKKKMEKLPIIKLADLAMKMMQKEEVELGEAKSGTGYDLYHKDFSSAMKHAYDHAKKKHGITVDSSEIDNKVATGPAKPKEGKTNTYRLKGDKGSIQVQVYNKGGSKPFELNMYKEEVDLDEGPQTDRFNARRTGKEGTVKIIKNKDGKFQIQKMTKGKFADIGKPYNSQKEAEKFRSGGQPNLFGEEDDLDEKMNSTTKKVIRKMAKKGTLPVRDMVKQAMSNPKNMKEEDDIDEARGRPRKDGTKSDSDDREQIQMQLRKSISLRGLKDVVFDDGKKVKVSARDARDVLGKLDAIKAPKERQNAVIHIAKSHKNLVDFAKGKAGEMDPEQRRKDAANSPFKKK